MKNKSNITKSQLDGLIELQKESMREPDTYFETIFYTINLRNTTVGFSRELATALAMRFDYILVISKYKFKYGDYINDLLKVTGILNKKGLLVNKLKINGWKLAVFKDGLKGGNYAHCDVIFDLVDLIGHQEKFSWNLSWAKGAEDGLRELDKRCAEFATNKEYILHEKIIQLKDELGLMDDKLII